MTHVEKLGDTMQLVLGRNEYQAKQEMGRYTSVLAEDLVRIMAWQQGKADARIREPAQVLGREFAGLWEALSYVIHHHQEAAASEEVCSLKDQVKTLLSPGR
jgi:ubiquinone biosynthesis protein UbiJ